ncbi:uncharacterized protein LOC112047391 [Bicyclus anynana]|uniref:Uncharacterized protein LOC112047391 n=1 Tax=Bicyclus anynana TaxID=110368 RepID=A0A6J1N5A5_BICAN|nr:uncharacterized protein LOC112047391 [Bicyclus anynana]
MGSRVGPTRIMCVNCNICVNKMRRYPALALDSRVTALICSWVYPQIILEDDYVCEACRDLAMAAVNANLQSEGAGPSTRGHTNVCLLCGCSILQRQSDKLVKENPTEMQQSIINVIESKVAPREISSSDRVCHACWLRTKREVLRMNRLDQIRPQMDAQPEPNQQSPSSEPQQTTEQEPIQRVTLPDYRRAPNSTHSCVFPNCNSNSFHNISDKLRATVLHNHKYYLPKLARICDQHLTSNSWDTLFECENSIETFTVEQIQHVFSFVNAFSPTLDFDDLENMDERVFEYWIGLSKEKFNILINEVPRIAELRKGSVGLASLLMKMRTGDSDERISTLVQVPRRTLEKLMDRIREILCQDFVDRHLGISHMTRDELIQHNLIIPKGLFASDNNAIVICDGTYIYINKSANYKFPKETYSTHKYRNLLKPFLIVASDGYILDCFGPYKATTSDAVIMNNLFNNENSALRLYFRNDDAFILDRGFRDIISLLEGCGYRPFMPESLLEGEHQLTTAQANRSRCVTICRWVVEVVNGYFKRDYKLLRQEYFHRSLPHMMQNFQIAAALINKFGVRLRDNEYASEIITIIRQNMLLENNLAIMVEALNMNRRSSNFINITADRNNISFPELEYRDLILVALGTYQIRQARSYYGEHIRFHGGYRIEVCSERLPSEYNLRGSDDTTLIRGKIKSRHVSRRQYYVYIIIENNVNGRGGIKEYYCSCLVGKRTVGCCAHTMTLIWYLGWARRQENITAPAGFLDEIVLRDDKD